MIKLIVVNKEKKYSYVKYLSVGDALKFCNNLYHVPPQSRRICIVHLVEDNSYDAITISRIATLISYMLPDRDTLMKYMKYPLLDTRE